MNDQKLADEFLFLSNKFNRIADLIFETDYVLASYIAGQLNQRCLNLSVEFNQKIKTDEKK